MVCREAAEEIVMHQVTTIHCSILDSNQAVFEGFIRDEIANQRKVSKSTLYTCMHFTSIHMHVLCTSESFFATPQTTEVVVNDS